MGPIQKIFYLHLPVAINTFLACLTAFIASIGYLWQRQAGGMIWPGRPFASPCNSAPSCCYRHGLGPLRLGRLVDWSPRLTFSLILFLLYVVYLVVRSRLKAASAGPSSRRSTASSLSSMCRWSGCRRD